VAQWAGKSGGAHPPTLTGGPPGQAGSVADARWHPAVPASAIAGSDVPDVDEQFPAVGQDDPE
jgi:hypothetical protein